MLKMVDELIDPSTGQWDIPLLEQTFWNEDVQAIRAIPVHADMPDIVGWHFDRKGISSVKSAYKL
jgi:hypothetical protein